MGEPIERDALKELEEWSDGAKGRYVTDMGIDPSYGATCWGVTLGNVDVDPGEDWHVEDEKERGKRFAEVYASEVSFFEIEGVLPPNVVFAERGEEHGCPGLARTILAAIDKANELGL